MRRNTLILLTILAVIFLTAQSCGNFAMQQQSSDALDCEYIGQLFCADDGKTRICNFINGAPHLKYDGQACDPETGKLLDDDDQLPVVDGCDLLNDGKYCEGNDRFTCENGDEDTSARITCSDGCVELVDKPGKASCEDASTSLDSDNDDVPSADDVLATQKYNYGFYQNSYGDTGTIQGYHYVPDSNVISRYDFGIFQYQERYKDRTAELVNKIKNRNPSFKSILRIMQEKGWPLDYYYSTNFKQTELNMFKIAIDSIGEHNIYGVTLSEEEMMNTYSGWYGKTAPDWATKYSSAYKTETGDSTWDWNVHLQRLPVNGDNQYKHWIVEKTVWSYNHLYDNIKSIYPSVKVYPFLYLPEDTSGWGWIEPNKIRKDGWIYQWGSDVTNNYLNSISPQYEGKFIDALNKIKNSGVPINEIFIQVWAYRDEDDVMFQIDKLKNLGIENFFVFNFAAWIPPDLPTTIYRDLDNDGVPNNGIFHESSGEGFNYLASRRELLKLNRAIALCTDASGNLLTTCQELTSATLVCVDADNTHVANAGYTLGTPFNSALWNQDSYSVATTTTQTVGAVVTSSPDACQTNSLRMLQERYCAADGSIKNFGVNCDTAVGVTRDQRTADPTLRTCSESKCVAPIPTANPCVDADGGDYPNIASYVSVNGVETKDSCSDFGQVKEGYCENGVKKSRTRTCDATHKEVCFDIAVGDACHVVTSCADSDGEDRYQQDTYTIVGAVTLTDVDGNTRIVSDSCDATGKLAERTCNNAGYETIYRDCATAFGEDYTCSSGKCVKNLIKNVQITCTDGDNSNEDAMNSYEVPSSATTKQGTTVLDTKADYCRPDGYLAEVFCSNSNDLTYIPINCKSSFSNSWVCSTGSAGAKCKDDAIYG